MKIVKPFATAFFIAAFIALVNPVSALACGSCYGAADTPATNGMNFAILSMLGITGSVLAALTSFFLYLRKRARLYLATIDAHDMTNEKGGIQ
jgi:threonine/homoserine/homoserine lactone efflux protein